MADDPMTIDSAVQYNLRPGLIAWTMLVSGPADLDGTNGSLMNLSAYVTSIKAVEFGACTAAADNLIMPRYVNPDFDAGAATGTVHFAWDNANSGDASDARLLATVANATNLSGYQWQVLVIGTPVVR